MSALKYVVFIGFAALFSQVSCAYLPAPTTVCEEASADVTFMLAPSYIGGEAVYKEMVSFVLNVLKSFKIGGRYVRVNVVTYFLDIEIQIHSNENQTFESISSALLKIQYEEGSGELLDTLEFLRKNVHEPSFGARPGVPKIIVYLTDMLEFITEESKEEVHKLLISKVTMFAVGVSEYVTKEGLFVIAGKSQNLIYGENFKSISKEAKLLPGKICKVDQCTSKPCRNGKVCKTNETSYQCVCPPGKDCSEKRVCTCMVSGDPHYRTFDGQMIHFMGICKYTLSTNKYMKRTTPFFAVEVKNEHRGNSRVSYTRMVDVKIDNVTIRLLPRHKILVDTEKVSLPIDDHHLFIANYSSGWINVYTEWGLHVKFDGRHRVIVTIRGTSGGFSGICGDCNGKKDDLKTKKGVDVSHEKNKFSKIGDSHKVNDDSDKPHKNCSVSNITFDCTEKIVEKCNVIRNEKIFGSCIKALGKTTVSEYFESCKIDICSYKKDKKHLHLVMCETFEGFAEECEKAGITVDWRQKVGCAMQCGHNEEYKYRTLTCQPTCLYPIQTCDEYTEACVCKPGYILSGTVCVRKEHCGCSYNGRYLQINETFYNNQCSKRITCVNINSTAEKQFPPCRDNSQCAIQGGIRQCVCDIGFALVNGKCRPRDACFINPCKNGGTCTSKGNTFHCTCAPEYRGKTCSIHMRSCVCKGHGDPHYQLFDGQGISFAGICKYLMATPKSGSNLTDFKVEVKNEHRKNDLHVSFTRSVEIKFEKFAVKLMHQRKVMVNDKMMKLPIVGYSSFSIIEKSGWLELKTTFGLHVRFNGKADFFIELSPIYRNHMTGICGNCNGVKDDYITKEGSDVSSQPDKYAMVVNSYQVFDSSLNADHICNQHVMKA